MNSLDLIDARMAEVLDTLRQRAEPFAIATIIRTAGVTAAKPGAKALLDGDGSIRHGWIGGGCTKGALKRSVVKAMQDGKPQLISVAPEEALSQQGVSPGDEVDGVQFSSNGCPSEGTIDIFVEPCFPKPFLVIYGNSPVAVGLQELATRLGWEANIQDIEQDLAPLGSGQSRMIVIATQGQGDFAALQKSLADKTKYIAFVGSRKKYAALGKHLIAAGFEPDRVNAVHAPAGLNIGAVTPEEIALSILAELTQLRRHELAGEVNGP